MEANLWDETFILTPQNIGWENFIIIIIFVFCLFMAIPVAYGSSQARGPIGAAAASLRHGRSNSGSELHLRPTPQLMATPDP